MMCTHTERFISYTCIHAQHSSRDANICRNSNICWGLEKFETDLFNFTLYKYMLDFNINLPFEMYILIWQKILL